MAYNEIGQLKEKKLADGLQRPAMPIMNTAGSKTACRRSSACSTSTRTERFRSKTAIFFSDNGTYDASNSYNMGSSTATVFLADGTTRTYDANTMPSSDSYPTVPEGLYEATVGKHQGKYTALRMHDVGDTNSQIDLGFENPAFSDGRTYAQGINIHKAGKNNYTGVGQNGNPVSAGCLVMDVNNWEGFIGNFNNAEQKGNPVGVVLSRTYSSPQEAAKPSSVMPGLPRITVPIDNLRVVRPPLIGF